VIPGEAGSSQQGGRGWVYSTDRINRGAHRAESPPSAVLCSSWF